MKHLPLIIILLFPFFKGKPVHEAYIYLDSAIKRESIAYQQTGFKGMATFKHLDLGRYDLIIEFPQQEGKWIKEKRRHITYTKASYNASKKTYYYQGAEGFFAIKISGLQKIEKESLQGVFRELRGEEENRIVVCRFHALRDGAAISVKINAITAAQFKRFTDKTKDLSTLSIPGER